MEPQNKGDSLLKVPKKGVGEETGMRLSRAPDTTTQHKEDICKPGLAEPPIAHTGLTFRC
jgi:hypothetical protein